MPDDTPGPKTPRRPCSKSGEQRRLYCPSMAGRTTVVGSSAVVVDSLGFVVGVVKDAQGLHSPPRSLSDEELATLIRVKGLVELSSAEARRLPLDNENRRRQQAFKVRATNAIEQARNAHGRLPTVREVQAVLAQGGHPKGRKEKIAALLRSLKRAESATEHEE